MDFYFCMRVAPAAFAGGFGTPGEPMVVHQRAMILLVRDPQDPPIGSVFYLMFAIRHGVTGPLAQELITLTRVTVAVSIVVHGVSVRPLMKWYVRRKSTVP